MPPQRADLVLSSDIPHGEGNVLVLDSLDVEACTSPVSHAVQPDILVTWKCGTGQAGARPGFGQGGKAPALDRGEWHTDGGNGRDDFSKLELVEDGGLSGGVLSQLSVPCSLRP